MKARNIYFHLFLDLVMDEVAGNYVYFRLHTDFLPRLQSTYKTNVPLSGENTNDLSDH